MNVNLIIKGNLLSNKLSYRHIGEREREREREREYKNNLNYKEKSEIICGVLDFSNFNIDNAIIIEGDLIVEEFLYKGIVLVTGHVCCKDGGANE